MNGSAIAGLSPCTMALLFYVFVLIICIANLIKIYPQQHIIFNVFKFKLKYTYPQF